MFKSPLVRRALALLMAAPLLTLPIMSLNSVAGADAPNFSQGGSHLAVVIHPLSASTCSGAVCINVTGTGLNVSDWNTTVRLSKSECSTASFWENGVKVATGESTCGSSGELLESDLGYVGNLPNGTELCNSWSGISGEPCATVHS